MTQQVQTQEKQKPRRVIRIVLAALILLAVAVGFHFYRVVQLSPEGHLSRFVPRGFQLFLHASRFKDGVDGLLASAEWKQLAGSGKLGRFQSSGLYSTWNEEIQALGKSLPIEPTLYNVKLLLGNDAALAVHWASDTRPPDWIVLTRTTLALFKTSAIPLPAHGAHRGITIHKLGTDDREIFICSMGDLVVASSSHYFLVQSIDLALGHRSEESLADNIPAEEAPGAALPQLTLWCDLKYLLQRTKRPNPYDESSTSLLGTLHQRIKDLSVPAELVGFFSVFLSNKVQLLEKSDTFRANIRFDQTWKVEASLHPSGKYNPWPTSENFSLLEGIPNDPGYCSITNIYFRRWFTEIIQDEVQDRNAVYKEIEQYCAFLGIKSFGPEFLDLFGPQIAMIISPQSPVDKNWKYLLPAVSFIIELKDPERISEYMEKSVERALADMREEHEEFQASLDEEERQEFPFEIQPIKLGLHTYYRVVMHENYLGDAFAPAFGIIGGQLVITTSARFMLSYAEGPGTENRHLSQSKHVKTVLTIPHAPLNSFWYISPPQLAEAIRPVASVYIETHQGWPPETRKKIQARLNDLLSLVNLFDGLALTSSQSKAVIKTRAISWFAEN